MPIKQHLQGHRFDAETARLWYLTNSGERAKWIALASKTFDQLGSD
jgi:hypothetical protein